MPGAGVIDDDQSAVRLDTEDATDMQSGSSFELYDSAVEDVGFQPFTAVWRKACIGKAAEQLDESFDDLRCQP